MSEKIDCIVAGHICFDIAPLMTGRPLPVEELFRPGKLINVGQAVTSTGGAVPNTALPLARLGVDVQLMGKCGDDLFGRALLDELRRSGQASGGMKVAAGERTSYSICLNPPGLDRMFLHCTGANDTFSADDVDASAVAAARLVHFGYPPLMARMYADGGKELVELCARIKAAGATLSLDMALPDPASPAGQADWKSICRAALPHVDVFTPSVEELTFMLQPRRFHYMVTRAGAADLLAQVDGDLLDELAEWCIDAGVAVVLIKCGHQGLYARSAGQGRLETIGRAAPARAGDWCNRQVLAPAYTAAEVVSATGAGDCSIAGFLAALLKGLGLGEALTVGCAVGCQNVAAADATSGVLDWQATMRQVQARGDRNELTIPGRWRWDDAQGLYLGPRDGQT